MPVKPLNSEGETASWYVIGKCF